MSSSASDDIFVMLCDWRGHCTWTSSTISDIKAGQFIWQPLTPESQEQTKTLLARVVTLRESQKLEVVHRRGDRFRGWIWPLDSPDNAACLMGVRVPNALTDLTQRERDCLELLAQGIDTRSIASQLEVSLSTVHTHMRRAREKLGIASSDALISFSARYCYPSNRPLAIAPSA
jgi:DNA-binding CsgD family transcriptional regulator